jgi:hypothetical protein
LAIGERWLAGGGGGEEEEGESFDAHGRRIRRKWRLVAGVMETTGFAPVT